MRNYLLCALIFLFCFSGIGYAQSKDRVLKRAVKTNTDIKTKSGYNQFLVDMIKDVDTAYAQYERLVQKVWDKELVMDLYSSSKDVVKVVDNSKQKINSMPVYLGAESYKNAVLQYTDIVKRKIQYLEKFGILGADPVSDINDYNTISLKFQETTNEGIEGRNKVRRLKEEFEKTVYVKAKK